MGFDEGAQAYRDGKPVTANPYSVGRYTKRVPWDQGWHSARLAAEKPDARAVTGGVCCECGRQFLDRPGGARLLADKPVMCLGCEDRKPFDDIVNRMHI